MVDTYLKGESDVGKGSLERTRTHSRSTCEWGGKLKNGRDKYFNKNPQISAEMIVAELTSSGLDVLRKTIVRALLLGELHRTHTITNNFYMQSMYYTESIPPKNPGRYGLKVWVTADMGTSYNWGASLYTRKESAAPLQRSFSRGRTPLSGL